MSSNITEWYRAYGTHGTFLFSRSCLASLDSARKVYALANLGKATNLMDALFGLELEEEFKCEESGESKVSSATAKKLVCNIQGGAGASTQVGQWLRRGVLCCVARAWPLMFVLAMVVAMVAMVVVLLPASVGSRAAEAVVVCALVYTTPLRCCYHYYYYYYSFLSCVFLCFM